MRIVLDLLASRDSAPAGHVAPEAVALCADLVPQLAASGADVLVTAPLAAQDTLETLRMHPGLAGRVRPIALHGEAPLQAVLRRHAIAGLAPSVVLAIGSSAQDKAGASELDCPQLYADAASADVAQLPGLLAKHADMASMPVRRAQRPKLAYVSPLPPVHSGIADYSAELLPELVKYYDVELVVDQEDVTDTRLSGMVRRSPAWLRDNAHLFERVLYHFGNSHAHQHMFELVRDVPGIVVLHDFFLSGVLDNLEREQYLPGGFMSALYESHGYTGLLAHHKQGRVETIWNFPLNKGVLDSANGVIVHADFSRELAERWYGPGAASGWRTIPLLRGRPDGADSDEARATARRAARQRLGIGDDEFIVSTFGMLGSTKLNAELLQAYLASPLANDANCRLVFVGANDPGPYGEQLLETIAASSAAERIRITGFVEAAAYADWLAASDCAVQLRTRTRGETSASVLDCLLYGVPTIVNAHGSTASLADDLVIKLDDTFAPAALADALASVRADASLRARLQQRALEHMRTEHAPAHVGQLYMEAIEAFTASGRASIYQRVISDAAPRCEARALPELAASIAYNRAPTAQRQLLVDVSALVQTDLKTGIQRVVRSILLSMIADPPPGYRIEPVFSHGGNTPYRYARRFGQAMVGPAELLLDDTPVETRPGDLFLGLDLFTTGTHQNEGILLDMRNRGVGVYFVVYDVLPMLRPDVFPYGTDRYFGQFLQTVHRVADGALCISRAVADELADWFASARLSRQSPFKLAWFHLGADIDASAPSHGLPPDADQVLAALAQRPSFLMVGTVEPRKGHTQALDAFELLWKDGVDANLVIVGKQGWMVDKLAARLAEHPEKAKRLFWLVGISDEMLLKLYSSATALLNPSEGEGFGLPLIEAAQHGIPILARDIPVFREVAGEHASFFSGLGGRDLADAIELWLTAHAQGKAPTSTGMPWLTWDASARQLLAALVGQQWYRTLEGNTTT